MRRVFAASPRQRVTSIGLFFWAAGGACFLTGFRVGADLTPGIVLTLFAVVVVPLPRSGD